MPQPGFSLKYIAWSRALFETDSRPDYGDDYDKFPNIAEAPRLIFLVAFVSFEDKKAVNKILKLKVESSSLVGRFSLNGRFWSKKIARLINCNDKIFPSAQLNMVEA